MGVIQIVDSYLLTQLFLEHNAGHPTVCEIL